MHRFNPISLATARELRTTKSLMLDKPALSSPLASGRDKRMLWPFSGAQGWVISLPFVAPLSGCDIQSSSYWHQRVPHTITVPPCSCISSNNDSPSSPLLFNHHWNHCFPSASSRVTAHPFLPLFKGSNIPSTRSPTIRFPSSHCTPLLIIYQPIHSTAALITDL